MTMRLGVCWYPEQWPAERWPVDAALMAEAGLELVRIGEFAWSTYEPRRGAFDWRVLDGAVEVLAAHGLDVVLGTPTATPPVWLVRERPEVVSVGPDGRQRAYGTRRHTCPTSPAYREEAARVVAALVDRYGMHDAVVAWQVDNEPGNHDSARCWCDACQAAFTAWLADRYGDVDRLNAVWGTAFWSQTYPDLEAVRLPVPTMTAHSPSLLLAHRRFSTHQVVEGLAEQRAAIAAGSPGREVTTNLYYGDLHVDAFAVAGPAGLAAVDSYPHDTSGPLETAFVLDLARGSSGPTRRFWVMEQQPGEINWTPRNPMVPPGQVRAWGLQAALHGAEALLVFRWRAGRAGQEQEHAGLLRHDGSPDRGLAEVAALRDELVALGPGAVTRAPATAALVLSYDDAWALEIDPHLEGLRHRDLVLPAYRAARRRGLEVDVVAPSADLRAYGLVLAPALHLTSPARVAALLAAAEAGALVVVGPRALVRDEDGVWADEALPAGLAAALGTRVTDALAHEVWPADPEAPQPVRTDPGGAPAGPWIDVLDEPQDRDVEVLLRAAGGTWLDGAPLAVRRGRLAYCGASSDEAWVAVLRALLDRGDVGPEDAVGSADVERFPRPGGELRLDHRSFVLTRRTPTSLIALSEAKADQRG